MKVDAGHNTDVQIVKTELCTCNGNSDFKPRFDENSGVLIEFDA